MPDNGLEEPLLERLSATPEPKISSDPKHRSNKRKRGAEPEPQTSKRSAKEGKSKKSKAVDDDGDLDVKAGLNKAFSHMDSQLLADYLAQRTRMYEKDLSSIELEEKYLPGMYCRLLGAIFLIKDHSKCDSGYDILG